MATATVAKIVWVDSTGRKSYTSHYFEPSNTYQTVKEAVKDIVQKEENLTDCAFDSATVSFPVEFGWFGDLTLKDTPNESDVENKGVFVFETVNGDTKTISVPGIKDSVVDDSTNLIDILSGPGQIYANDVLTNGFLLLDAITQLNETDHNGNALRRITGAYQRFSKSRRSRSAIKRMQ